MNAGPGRLGSRKPTCVGMGAESGCTNPRPCREKKWWGNIHVRFFPGVPCLFRIPGGGKVGPSVPPAPTNPFGNPFRKTFRLLNQIPAVFQVLLFTAGGETAQTRSALDAFAPCLVASCRPEPRRAVGAAGLNQISPRYCHAPPRGIAPDFCSAPGDQLGLFGDGGDKGFSPSDPLLSCSAPSTSSWLREPSSQPRRGSWQPLNCPSPRELGRKGAITAAHCRANLKQESGCGFKCNSMSSLGAMDRGEENKE